MLMPNNCPNICYKDVAAHHFWLCPSIRNLYTRLMKQEGCECPHCKTILGQRWDIWNGQYFFPKPLPTHDILGIGYLFRRFFRLPLLQDMKQSEWPPRRASTQHNWIQLAPGKLLKFLASSQRLVISFHDFGNRN